MLNFKFPPHLTPNEEFQLDLSRSVQEQAAELPYNVSWEFPRTDVSCMRLLGTGNLGKLFEAVAAGICAFNPGDESDLSLESKMENFYKRQPWSDSIIRYFRKHFHSISHSEETIVAVKCLAEKHSEKDYSDLAAELKLMIHIGRHKNIVNLLGACTIKGPLWLILEYCSNGDLLTFLRSQRQLFPRWESGKDDTSPESVCFADLTRVATEICEGIIFLSEQGVVHRDLSARNIFLTDVLQVKIGKFGSSCKVGSKGATKSDTDDITTVRWMSLESLQMGAFTSRSDVWSFGVVVWEMFTMGGRPYPGIPNKELATYLLNGNRMSAPEHCPEDIYKIMLTCWSKKQSERPTFGKLIDMFKNVLLNVFRPPDDYYSGKVETEKADAMVEVDDVINSEEILRKQRIIRLLNLGVPLMEDKVDNLLQELDVKESLSADINSSVGNASSQQECGVVFQKMNVQVKELQKGYNKHKPRQNNVKRIHSNKVGVSSSNC